MRRADLSDVVATLPQVFNPWRSIRQMTDVTVLWVASRVRCK